MSDKLTAFTAWRAGHWSVNVVWNSFDYIIISVLPIACGQPQALTVECLKCREIAKNEKNP